MASSHTQFAVLPSTAGAAFAALVCSIFVAGSACEPAGKRRIGAACEASSECESALCYNGQCLDPAADDDGDGLTNGIEVLLQTNPFSADSDGDGDLDGAEVGTDPDQPPDTDGDSKNDALESASADSDGDCIADQFDPDDSDVRNVRGLEVCSRVGLCAQHSDHLSASCEIIDGAPLWTCDPSKVPGYGVSDTTCDGVDEDCDGETDEDFVGTDAPCESGSCAASAPTRCVGGSVQSSCVAEAAAEDATCDGVDDDCDGTTDDDFVVLASECGVGACGDVGTVECVAGKLVDDCVAGEAAADDRECNGEDDDCDGMTDEDATRAISCGEGACRAEGFANCDDGVASVDCVSLDVAASDDATCDGIDGDCDGATDEDYVASDTTCGVGACLARGVRDCVQGGLVDSCVPGTAAADDATCNGVDEDCNGVADEDYAITVTSCGRGVCNRNGLRTCVDGGTLDGCVAGSPTASDDKTCDGVDDDCDDVVDEDVAQQSMSCGRGACTTLGTRTCDQGTWIEDCHPVAPPSSVDDACDGIDDNCDGVTDEGWTVVATSCGVGVCAGSGISTCEGGVEGDTCTAGTGAARDEDCDNVDDDCDGTADEDYVAPVTSCGRGACVSSGLLTCDQGVTTNTCVADLPAASDTTCNGVDDDCDDATDESYVGAATTCGVGRCEAGGGLVCVEGGVLDDCTPRPPNCTGRQCGSDGCEGSCGTCPAPAASCLEVACNGGGQCATTIKPGFCFIASACVATGGANPGNDCQYCDASLDTTGWSSIKLGTQCADEGNTCTVDTCDGQGTCGHAGRADLTTCNDSDGATIADWCVSATCHGFFSRSEPKRSPPDQALFFEHYRRGAVGPVTPSVAGVFQYTDANSNDRSEATHYSTGTNVLPAVLNTSTSLVALDGTRIVQNDTMWEYAGQKWLKTRDNGTLRLVWGSDGDEFPVTFERLIHFTAILKSFALAAGRTNDNGGMQVRQCSLNAIAGGGWSCAAQNVFTGDYASFPAQLVRAASVNYLFANAGTSRTSPTAMKVLKYVDASWRSDATLSRSSTAELKDVLYESRSGWFIGVGAANTLWVTKLAGYFDIAIPGGTYTWQQAVAWRGNVVVLGTNGTTSTNVVLAWAPLDAQTSDASRWKVHTLWTGQTLLATSLVAPNDNELYVLGGDRLGSTLLSPTVRALWRYTTAGTPL